MTCCSARGNPAVKCPLYMDFSGVMQRKSAPKKGMWKNLKNLKNLEKTLDKGRRGWYYVKAVRRDDTAKTAERVGRKNFEKSRKNLLTKAGRCGNM